METNEHNVIELMRGDSRLDVVNFVIEARSKEKGDRYTVMNYVLVEKDGIVATDGKKLYRAGIKWEEWVEEGLYEVVKAGRKNRLVRYRKGEEEGLRFPNYENLFPVRLEMLKHFKIIRYDIPLFVSLVLGILGEGGIGLDYRLLLPFEKLGLPFDVYFEGEGAVYFKASDLSELQGDGGGVESIQVLVMPLLPYGRLEEIKITKGGKCT